MQAPTNPAADQPTLSTVERLFKESLKLQDANPYKLKMDDLADAIQAQVQAGNLKQIYATNLISLTTPEDMKPISAIDHAVANYAVNAYKAFMDGKESHDYKEALSDVTTKLQAIKTSFHNNKLSSYQKDTFKSSIENAKAQRPLTKNQKALNTALLCVFIATALTASILAPVIPSIGIYLALSIISVASTALAIYQGVKMVQRKPTMFNAKPKECKVADKAAQSIVRMQSAKS